MYFDHSLSPNTFPILPLHKGSISFLFSLKKQNKTKEQQQKRTHTCVCAHTRTCTHPAKKPKHGIPFVLASDTSL